MTDLELSALIALVNADTAEMNSDVSRYGTLTRNFDYTARFTLWAELERRGILQQRPAEETSQS